MKDEKIIFFSNDHSYWFGDRKIPSVGKFFKKYFPQFDEDYWSTHITLKELLGDTYMDHYRSIKGMKPHPDVLFPPMLDLIEESELERARDVVLMKWERKRNNSSFFGTKFHDKMEAKIYDDGFLLNPFTGDEYPVEKQEKEYDNESLTLNLYDLKDGAYPELLVFDPFISVSGQADMVFIETIGDKRFIDINDWKTNEKKPQKSSPDRCLQPFEYLQASKHMNYSFQINIYAKLLEMHGFTIRNLAYTWIKDYDESQQTLVNVDELTNEMDVIFNEN